MPDVTRTFVALEIPRAVCLRLARLQDELAAEIPGVRWSGGDQAHLTLVFLGDVPHADLAAVCLAVEGATRWFPPMELSFRGLGVFPNANRPRVLWAGLAGPAVDTLRGLQAAVASAVAAAGYAGESQRFHPHVTLGRFKTAPRGGRRANPGSAPTGPPDLAETLVRRAKWSAGPFRVLEVVTYSSTLTPEGSVYAPLARARLKSSP